MARKEGSFKLKRKISFKDISESTELPESDLCFQDEKHIFQFEFVDSPVESKIDIEPGIFTLQKEQGQIKPKKLEIRSQDLLKSITNSKAIIDEANIFFNNLDVYEELGEPKARKLLIYSDPGMGKTSTITDYCNNAVLEDPGTVVLIWPTSSIESSDMLDFLTTESEYTKECTRLILIMEDIGGGEREGSHSAREVDSAMLDILDGIGLSFKLPTLIIATTNYPQNLLSALADRPGRFDLIIKLDPPSLEERISIVEFISKRSLDEEEKQALADKSVHNFSIAHLKELVIRSRLHKKSLKACIKELADHKKRFNKGFSSKEDSLGFGS